MGLLLHKSFSDILPDRFRLKRRRLGIEKKYSSLLKPAVAEQLADKFGDIIDINSNVYVECPTEWRQRLQRRLTVTGCSGKQVVDRCCNNISETTVDKNGVKTTSFCFTSL